MNQWKVKTKPKQRLLNAASVLFNRNGFEKTSVQDLLNYADSHKASFYKYFSCKANIAMQYLDEQEEYFLGFLSLLQKKHQKPFCFFQLWVKLILRQVKNGNFFGCPVVTFAATIDVVDESEVALRNRAFQIERNWAKQLSKIITIWKNAGYMDQTKCEVELANIILTLYQGKAILYRATGQEVYLQSLEEAFIRLVK